MPDEFDRLAANLIARGIIQEEPATTPVAGSPASSTWHYPYWPRHDVAWEEER